MSESDSASVPRNVGEFYRSESCRWLNRYIRILQHHFKDAKSEMFEKIIIIFLNVIYNKNRPNFLSEIAVKNVIIGGKAPELLSW